LQYELQTGSASGVAGALPAKVSFAEILAQPMVWAAFGFFFFATFGFGALQNFAPSLLRELFDLSLGAATSALSIYLIGSGCGLLVGGFLAKPGNAHEGYVAAAFGMGAAIAMCLALLPLPVWVVLPVMAAMGFAVGIAGPSRDLLVYSGLDVGLAVAPIAFGLLLDAHQPRWVFVGISLSLICAIVAAWSVARTSTSKNLKTAVIPANNHEGCAGLESSTQQDQ
jgi:predicted MFS family arabinose efflux permease